MRSRPPSTSDQIVFVGRLSEEKGVEDLLEAWELARASDTHLVVVGDGPLRSVLERATGSGVEIRGRLSHRETVESMSSARAVVHPSRWFEGLPMVLVEAAATGTPAVIPAHGALPDVVGSGGWTYDSGDVSSLARVLGNLSDQVVDEAGRHARANYEAEFSQEAGLSALESVYETARRGRRA